MQFLYPCNDVAFKKIFGSQEHQQVTISFLNAILEYQGDQRIIKVQFQNTEQKGIVFGKKENILDILCTDQIGRKYIVEVQVAGVDAFDKRLVYYGTKTYSMQLTKTRRYHQLDPVICVAVLDFSLFKDSSECKSIHVLMNNKTYKHQIKELTFAFIELPKFHKQEHELETDEDKWIYFLKNIASEKSIPASLNNDEFKEACHAANRMTWTEGEFNDYIDAIILATDREGELSFAHREGEQKRAEEIAAKLLQAGRLSVGEISEITGLSAEDIEKIKNDNNC